mmetsp:Transcript_30715/g.29323  ORF Transcript_30715/g.29323 Transcript_30715/m.29323 type:complete len:315 (-) Transcript_30715:220-1164(-)
MSSRCFSNSANTFFVTNSTWTAPSRFDILYANKTSCPEVGWPHKCCTKYSPEYVIDSNCVDFSSLLQTIRNQKVSIFGDSLSYNTFVAFKSQLIISEFSFISTILPGHQNNQLLYINDYNATVELYEFYQIKLPAENLQAFRYKDTIPSMLVDAEVLIEKILECDTAIFNIGLHFGTYTNTPTSIFLHQLRWIKHVLEQDMIKFPTKQHIYRLSYPQHFLSPSPFTDGLPSGDYVVADYPHSCSMLADRHWSDILAVGLFTHSKIKVVDYYEILRDRGEYHSVSNPMDCTHFCYNHQLWRPFWGLLTYTLKATL